MPQLFKIIESTNLQFNTCNQNDSKKAKINYLNVALNRISIRKSILICNLF